MAEATSNISTPSVGLKVEEVCFNQPGSEGIQQCWFALRDLNRANAKTHAYKTLPEKGIEVFTPMKWKVEVKHGRRKRILVPVLLDLIFAHSDKDSLDSIIAETPYLQYRYARGAYCKPIVVRNEDMDRFIRATTLSPDPVFYSPIEISTLSIGRSIKIIGGPMTGVEGKIVNVRGARKKRILVSIPDFIAAVVEVESNLLEFI